MPLKTNIIDGTSTRIHAKVTENHALLVEHSSRISLPPVGQRNTFRYLVTKLGSTGGDSGVTDMKVNGSVTPQEFFVGASNEFDIRVMGIQVLLADGAISMNKFGEIIALTNGFDLFVVESGVQTDLITKATTTGEMLIASTNMDSYEIVDYLPTGADMQVIYFPINELVPGGIRLGISSTDFIKAVVNDDLTGLELFEARLYGYTHFSPDED